MKATKTPLVLVPDETTKHGEVCAHTFEQPENIAAGIDAEAFVRREFTLFGDHVLSV